MKNQDLNSDPLRWSEQSGGDSFGDLPGEVFRRVRAATDPSPPTVAGWTRRGMTVARHQALRVPAATKILSMTLLAGGAVASAPYVWHHFAGRATAPQAAIAVNDVTPPSGRTPAPVIEQLPTSSPELQPTPSPAATGHARRGSSGHPDRQQPELDEATLLARAFRSLRTNANPRAALLDLEAYQRRYPDGRLTAEAATARAEALVALGRADDALPILMGIRETGEGLTRDLRLSRAEMLAKAGRCDEAEKDFQPLIDGGATDPIRERALYDRASCRLRAGKTAAARSDLERYVAQFPGGQFVTAVRLVLQKL
jgi:Tetratricopeptide repeat